VHVFFTIFDEQLRTTYTG